MGRPRMRIEDKRSRKALILDAAVRLAKRGSFGALTRETIATEAGIAPSTIGHACGTMENFRRDIMRHAVKHGIVEIVAHGLAAGHPIALKAPQELKERASQHIAGV